MTSDVLVLELDLSLDPSSAGHQLCAFGQVSSRWPCGLTMRWSCSDLGRVPGSRELPGQGYKSGQ